MAVENWAKNRDRARKTSSWSDDAIKYLKARKRGWPGLGGGEGDVSASLPLSVSVWRCESVYLCVYIYVCVC